MSTSLSQLGAYQALQAGFARCGLDAQAMFASRGVDPAASGAPDLPSLADAFSAVWMDALARTGQPAIGLATVPSHPVVGLGVAGHLIVSSPNLLVGLSRLARYTNVISPTLSGAMDSGRPEADDPPAPAACRIVLKLTRGQQPVPPARHDFAALSLVRVVQWIAGGEATPLRVSLPYDAPTDAAPWQRAYGCAVDFAADDLAIEIPMPALTRPSPMNDPSLAEMSERLTSQRSKMMEGSLTAKVRHLLAEAIPKRAPRREVIAATLCMSERTLQRRLQDEGVQFSELVDEVRRQMALEFFVSGRRNPTEISFSLGFSDPSNFYRACKRWFGCGPNEVVAQA